MYVGINGIHSTAITSEELGFIFHGTKRNNQDFLFLFIQGIVFKERNKSWIEFLFKTDIVEIIKCVSTNMYFYNKDFLFRFRFFFYIILFFSIILIKEKPPPKI